MIATSNLSIQFGAKPLFENVSVKFGNGNRYGLIGANGCGKSTFMKILGGDLEPSSGNVARPGDVRLGKLRQDQFAYENNSVLDTVIMGHEELWQVKAERDRIYALPEMSEDDGMAVAELEVRFAELDGYTAEARAGELLLGLGIALVCMIAHLLINGQAKKILSDLESTSTKLINLLTTQREGA
jgi:ATPase subunit of ABC transporter with duplicated ATPase domains